MKRATSFNKVVVCHTNDFGELNEKMKLWIEANHGTYAKDLSRDVTHLVASKKAWKQYHPLVKEARKMRSVYIVSYDWLEDSLLKVPVKALPPEKYMFEQAKLRPIKKTPKSIKASMTSVPNATKKIVISRDKRIETSGIEFDKAVREFETDMMSVGFHPYSDNTGFVYIITLIRYDVLKCRLEKYKLKVGANPPSISRDIIPGKYMMLHLFPAPGPFSTCPVVDFRPSTISQHYSRIHLAKPWAMCLQLYESDKQPHTYACYLQYTRPGIQKKVIGLAPPGSTWSFAWSMFEKYFLKKVGTSWDNRTENGTEVNFDREVWEDSWQYLAPRLGEPEGVRSSGNITQEGDAKSEKAMEGNWYLTPYEEVEIDDTHHP